MNQELYDFAAEHIETLSTSSASKQDTREMAAAWLENVPADADAAVFEAETGKLLDHLESRLVTIDSVIAFAEGPAAGMFGEEAAAQMLAAQRARKERGEKYCDCEAHTAATQLLAKFGRIEL